MTKIFDDTIRDSNHYTIHIRSIFLYLFNNNKIRSLTKKQNATQIRLPVVKQAIHNLPANSFADEDNDDADDDDRLPLAADAFVDFLHMGGGAAGGTCWTCCCNSSSPAAAERRLRFGTLAGGEFKSIRFMFVLLDFVVVALNGCKSEYVKIKKKIN